MTVKTYWETPKRVGAETLHELWMTGTELGDLFLGAVLQRADGTFATKTAMSQFTPAQGPLARVKQSLVKATQSRVDQHKRISEDDTVIPFSNVVTADAERRATQRRM